MWNRTQKRPFNVVITTLQGHNGIFFMYYQFIEHTLSSLLFIKHFSAPVDILYQFFIGEVCEKLRHIPLSRIKNIVEKALFK